MVEKEGHKKIMQIARVGWIDEGKPRSSVHEDSIFDEAAAPREDNEGREKSAPRIAPIFESASSGRPKTPAEDDLDALFGDDGDIYDATPKAAARKQPIEPVSQTDSLFGGGAVTQSIFGSGKDIPVANEFPEDDLDALLAEEELMKDTSEVAITSKPVPSSDNFDDEMEAMQGMDW
jgi:replication fork protection complex subunit Csm3/Swi3